MSENAKLVEFNGTAQEVSELAQIAKDTQKILAEEHHIKISLADAIPTIVYAFIHRATQFLDENKEKESDRTVNLMNLIEIGVTYRESGDGEKSGNFTPFLQPGTIMKTIIKSDEDEE